MRFDIEPRTRKYVQKHGFLTCPKKYKKQILDEGLHTSKKK